MKTSRLGICLLAATASIAFAQSTDLTLKLTGKEPIHRGMMRYDCDENAPKLGLPARSFEVEWIWGAGNSFEILPLNGGRLVFSAIENAHYTKFAAGHYVWAGRQNMRSLSAVDENWKETAVTYCTQHQVK